MVMKWDRSLIMKTKVFIEMPDDLTLKDVSSGNESDINW